MEAKITESVDPGISDFTQHRFIERIAAYELPLAFHRNYVHVLRRF